MTSVTVARLAGLVDCSVRGDGDHLLKGIAPLEAAGPEEIAFLANPRYASQVGRSKAGCIIAIQQVADQHPERTFLVARNPYYVFALVSQHFHPPLKPAPPGIDPRTVIEESVLIGANVTIMAFVYISKGSTIGDRVTLYPNVFIGQHCTIGDDTLVYPNVAIREGTSIGKRVIIHSGTVIGSDGYGFATEAGIHHKIPQAGDVIIEDDVELGAGVTIDRGTLGSTIIGRGTKFDNQVHIAHNVTIGEHSLLVAQVGISGSTKVGKGVTIAGQSGLTGHITVGDHAIIGAGSAVLKNVKQGAVVSGLFPARDHNQAKRIIASMTRVPALLARVRKIEAVLGLVHQDEPVEKTGQEKIDDNDI